MGFSCGIVGLPNVGKSTLFNALTRTASAQAANYPFTTIEPNVGRVAVPDNRLEQLGKIADSSKIIPTQIEFVDIAGLVRGASSGEGLGNKFLGHIRQVDAILHLVRCFEGSEVSHIDNFIDPVSDAEVIETELLLADLESVERRIQQVDKKTSVGDKYSKQKSQVMLKVLDNLKNGIPAAKTELSNSEKTILSGLDLITSKPYVYVCNLDESDVVSGNQHSDRIKLKAQSESRSVIYLSAQMEADLASLSNEEEREEYLNEFGLIESGLSRVIREGYDILRLLTFFTAGPNETRAWTINKGAKAPRAANSIHSDMERGFIRAEVISYDDYIDAGSEAAAKAAGKMRSEGKDYVVQDGDVVLIRFNV